MTDKQIIIDGVDVRRCERHCTDNRNNPNMCYSEMTRTYSKCNPKEKQCNFYITSIEKQLKRKEQECENISNAYEQCKESRLKAYNKIDELTQQLEAYKMEAEEGKEINAELKAENEELKVYKSITPLKVKMLVKTITEIKEIAAEKSGLYLNIDEVKTATELEYDYAGKIWDLEQIIHKILQKISEVE